MTTINHQVKGASVELETLQQLRFLAQGFIRSKQKARALLSGGHKSNHHSRGMEFEEVRLYQAGDDVRTIDWRVTARTQTPHTKCFQEEKEKPVITLVDQRRSMFFGSQHCFKSVYACQLSALINWATLARSDRCGGMVIGSQSISTIRPNRTKSSLNRWLMTLTNFNHQLLAIHKHKDAFKQTEPTLENALKQLDNSSQNGTEIILISDFYDLNPQCENMLFKLAKHHTLSLYWLVDPLEIELPLIGQATFSNGIQNRTLTVDKALQKESRLKYLNKKEQLTELCRRLKSGFVQINTETPLLDIYQHRS